MDRILTKEELQKEWATYARKQFFELICFGTFFVVGTALTYFDSFWSIPLCGVGILFYIHLEHIKTRWQIRRFSNNPIEV